jgi:hypothetical protein
MVSTSAGTAPERLKLFHWRQLLFSYFSIC